MHKKIVLLMSVVFVLASLTLLLTGCNKDKKTLPQGTAPVEFYNAPLPQFADVFNAMSNLKNADFDKALADKPFATDNDVYKTSFALGSLTADAIVAVKARNKTKLTQIAQSMIDYSKLIGIDENILKLADELQNLIKTDKWADLEAALDKYKTDVESSLFESRQYELFTLMQLGGWTEGLNRISFLINANYDSEKSTLVDQKGILNSLISNMDKITNENIRSQKYYATSVKNYKLIKDIIYAPTNGAYTADQLTKLNSLTTEIKSQFGK